MRILLIILLVIGIKWLLGQSNPDIDTLVYQGKELVSKDPDSSLILSRRAYRQSLNEDYYWGTANAAGWISEAYYYLGKKDSINKYNNIALELSREEKDWPAVGDNLVSIAQAHSDQGRQREALVYFAEAQTIKEEIKDTVELSDMHLRIGAVYDDLDIADSAMIQYDIALNYARAINHKELIGQSLNNMAIVHKRLGEFEQSLDILKEAKALFESEDNKYGLLINHNMTGVIYKNLARYDEALIEYEELYKLAKELKFRRGEMAYGINTGTIYNLLERYPEAKSSFEIGVEIASDFDIPLSLSDAKSGLGKSLLGLNRIIEAETEVKEALAIAEEIGSLDKQLIAHEVARRIYEKKNLIKQTVYHLESIQTLKDSVFNIEKAKQVDELQTKYETSKKDAAILILNKEAELDATKKKALWGGMGLLALLAGGIIYGQSQRRKRIQQKAHLEKQIEIDKRTAAEHELEFKKKELTAKALQLARKNEFLHNLEEEVVALKSSVDTTVGKTSDRITRMIQMDANDDNEWEQFGKEFSSIHQDFLDRLKVQYGKFSKNEIRLISLMKMNLSSKDIANTLRISDDGIKKARYRLRKKMELDGDVDIHNYLIGY